MHEFFISGPLPGLNDHEKAARGSKYAASTLKSRWTCEAEYCATKAKLAGLMLENVFIRFLWVENGKRRDPDNIVFAKKYILDGLVRARVIPGDGWKHISGFTDTWEVGQKPGVHVQILPV